MTGAPSAERIADRLLADLAPHDAVAAALTGAPGPGPLPTLAPADFAARHDAKVAALAALDAARPTGTLAAVLRERLEADLALDDLGFTTSLLAPLATPVHEVRAVFDAPHESAADWQGVGEALALVPGALADYAETLRSAPRTVASRQVLGAAAQCRGWIQADQFYRRLVAGHPELAGAAEGAGQATLAFADFLDTELVNSAPEVDAVGAETYAVTARAFLGEEVDLLDTYAFGWAELAELSAEMSALAGNLGCTDVEASVAALDADPAGRLSTGQLAPWLSERLAETADALDGVHFDLPPQARLPAARLSPTAAGVMYYDAPDADLTRPGTVWWSAPAGGSTSTWREVTTLHHEGIPGHHLQIATALTAPQLHPWQRGMVAVHGYAEGWAHYAERLAQECGLLRDDGEALGMLLGQRLRAARIVIDMGLHLDLAIPANAFTAATRWTPAVGREVLRRAAGADDVTARFEVDRYLGWPAQALAFRVGARLWSQLRDTAAARPGFEARAFHMAALRLGPMGLGTLREVLA